MVRQIIQFGLLKHMLCYENLKKNKVIILLKCVLYSLYIYIYTVIQFIYKKNAIFRKQI